METQYCELEDSAIVNGGNWVMKIKGWKNRKRQFDFFSCDFSYPISPSQSQYRWIRDIVSLSNIFENLFSIFSAAILVNQFPHRNRRTVKFAILRLRTTFLRIKNFQKCLKKIQYCEFDCPAIVMGGGRECMTKIAAEKIKDYEVGPLFFDVYRHLAKPDDEVDRPPSTR